MRIAILVLASLAAATIAASPAQASHACVPDVACVHWECLQVYPWSRLCEGDVVGFIEAVLEWVPEWLEPCLILSDGVVCP